MNVDEILAQQAAAAQRAHADAEQARMEAIAKVQRCADRIAETEQRRAAITESRLSGNSTPDEAAELVALGEDLVVLRRLHTEAEAEAAATVPAVEAAGLAAGRAESAWAQHKATVEYEALLARTREIEAALLRAVRATHDAGRQIGHRYLRASWMPGNELVAAVTKGAL